MNNHSKGNFVYSMPGKLFYTIDKDITHEIKQDKLTFLIDNNPNCYKRTYCTCYEQI